MAGHWPGCCLDNLTCFLQSNLDCSRSKNLERPLSQETSSTSSVARSSQDKRHMWDPLDSHRGDTFDMAWYGKVNSRMDSLPPDTCQPHEPQEGLRPPSVPSLATQGLKGPVPLGRPKGLGSNKTQIPRSVLSQLSKPSKVSKWFLEINGSLIDPQFPCLDRLSLDKCPLLGVGGEASQRSSVMLALLSVSTL